MARDFEPGCEGGAITGCVAGCCRCQHGALQPELGQRRKPAFVTDAVDRAQRGQTVE